MLLIALRTAGTVILARLLTPRDFGVVSMVMVVVVFAGMFKDAGLSTATVQQEHISHEQISTLFWVNTLFSGVLTLLLIAASPLVARFYNEPELGSVTSVLSLSFVISGLTIQHQALLTRHMRFGALAAVQVLSQVASLGVTTVLALMGWRYWALVGGTLAIALAGTLATFYYCPWIPGPMRRGTGARRMLTFGGHLTAFNFVNYFSRNLDNILIGRYIGAEALGLYSRAYQLFMMPITQVRSPLNQVAIPLLSGLNRDPTRYARYYERLLGVLATLTVPLTLYCVLEAEFLIRVLLGTQWLGAVPVFRVLAIAGMTQPLAGTTGLVQVTCGFSAQYFEWGVVTAVASCLSFVVGLPFGIEGVAMAYAVASYLLLVPSLLYCFRNTPVSVALFTRAVAVPLAVGGLAALTTLLVKHAWPGDTLVMHGCYAGTFWLVYFGFTWGRRSVRDTAGLLLSRRSSQPSRAPGEGAP